MRKLVWCPKESMGGSSLVSVKLFQDVETMYEGRLRKRKDLLKIDIPAMDLVEKCRVKFQKFIKHNFVYQWQATQFKNCVTEFPSDVIVSVVDFAENYTFKEQNEIQSMHWWSNQVTIFVHITYYRSQGEIQKVVHFFISDDKKHDTLFVQHCFMLHWGWAREQNTELRQHWVWSDGAASQFKAKRPFYFVGRYQSLTGLSMIWNFFESGHGKGEHDGAGAVIKRALTHEQLKADGEVLKNAGDVVEFLRKHFQDSDVKRVFWEVGINDVNRENEWNCEGIPQLRTLHSVRGYTWAGSHCIGVRQLSCYCYNCTRGLWKRCANRAHVTNWEYHTMVPLEDMDTGDTRHVDNEMFMTEGNGDQLSDALMVGDTFAVNAEEGNPEGADFYLLKCIQTKTLATTAICDGWDNNIGPGTFYVTGVFYERIDDAMFRLLDSAPPAYLYSHLVRSIKIPLTQISNAPNSALYSISLGAYEAIYNSMPWDLVE